MELDVLARLDYRVLIKLVLATVGNSVSGDAPDLAELLTDFFNALASNVARLVVNTITDVCHSSGTVWLSAGIVGSFHCVLSPIYIMR
jgi:hypothetical protein